MLDVNDQNREEVYATLTLKHLSCREGSIISVQLLGGPRPYNLGGQKASKIRFDFGQLDCVSTILMTTLDSIANIFGTH